MESNIIDMQDYKSRSKQFRESYAVNMDELAVPKCMERGNRQERYTAPRGTVKRANKKPKRKLKKLLKRGLAIGTACLIAFGGYKAYSEYKDSQNTLTLEQALENGETLDKLGIDRPIEEKLSKLEEIMQSDLTNQELIELSDEMVDLQFDTIKTKLSNTLGIEEKDIKLYPREDENEGARVDIKGNIYTEKGIIEFENTISSDIANYIDEIGNMQTLQTKLEGGNFDRSDVIKAYTSVLKETSKFAAAEMKVDEKGNITLDKIRVSSLEKDKGQERDD